MKQVTKVNLVGIETKGAVQTSSPGSPGCDDDDDDDDDVDDYMMLMMRTMKMMMTSDRIAGFVPGFDSATKVGAL